MVAMQREITKSAGKLPKFGGKLKICGKLQIPKQDVNLILISHEITIKILYNVFNNSKSWFFFDTPGICNYGLNFNVLVISNFQKKIGLKGILKMALI